MRTRPLFHPQTTRPSPHGEGGLKSGPLDAGAGRHRGPSPHGEGGLKCYKQPEINKANLSLPTRGGWIEMARMCTSATTCLSPSPHGEGGLKYRH